MDSRVFGNPPQEVGPAAPLSIPASIPYNARLGRKMLARIVHVPGNHGAQRAILSAKRKRGLGTSCPRLRFGLVLSSLTLRVSAVLAYASGWYGTVNNPGLCSVDIPVGGRLSLQPFQFHALDPNSHSHDEGNARRGGNSQSCADAPRRTDQPGDGRGLHLLAARAAVLEEGGADRPRGDGRRRSRRVAHAGADAAGALGADRAGSKPSATC